MMIRPSALGRAALCGLVPILAELYPESSAHSESGEEIHRQIRAALSGGSLEQLSPQAAAAVALITSVIADIPDVEVHIEYPLALRDPENGELLSEGTGDIVLVFPDEVIALDWKTGRQADLAHPNDNIQIKTYATAAALEFDKPRARGVLVRFPEGADPVVLTSEPYDLWAVLDEVRAISRIGPEARPGQHCMSCFQRHVCPSWRERAATGMELLSRARQAENTPENLSSEAAVELLQAIKAVREAADAAESLVRAAVMSGLRVEANGQVYERGMVQGRRSGPSVQDLETLGLTHLIRPGRPYEQWRWRRP